MSPKRRYLLVSAMFLASGATGLLYEVAFSKVLATIFGATAYAVSTVLSAFMAGLALGAHLGGRVAGRFARPLAAYGLAELCVGAICAATPAVFAALERAYLALAASGPSLGALTLVRGGLTFAVILVPTACMGATLPLLARAFASDPAGKARLPRLYAINTLGGAAGSLLCAYAILPALGIRGTMQAAALVNVAVGLAAIALGRGDDAGARQHASDALDLGSTGEGARDNDTSVEAPSDGDDRRALLAFAFASGFLVFAAEVVETHLLTLLIGNSAYAFGLMLAVFLLCLGIGAARSPWLATRASDAALGVGLALAALAIALTMPGWDQLPRVFAAAGKVVHGWGGRELCRALAALAILVVPTLFMGTTFPLLLAQVAGRSDVPAEVGRLTVANTAGTIAGSLVTGYVVLPALGSQRTLAAIAVAFAAMAAIALRRAKPARRRVPLVVAGLGALAAIAAPAWDLARLTNGANVYFTYGPAPDAIEFVREDVHGGVTTVARRGSLRTLYTNGKFQGDDGPEMTAQRRFAHFPGLFLPREERALVIGLGTGTTLGAVASYPFSHIDVAEISPAIVEASRRFYAGPARGSLDDPRVRLALNDGRNELLVATAPYDLVAIELTSVWFAGASNLYSREFYELVRRKLSPGGVLQQWVQLHHIRPRELATIVRTLEQTFAHVALFEGGAQGILVASEAPLVASRARLAKLDALPAVRETLEGRPLHTLLDELVASEGDLARLTRDVADADGGPLLSTDDNLYLEYATPKGNVLEYRSSLDATRAFLDRYRTRDAAARHLGP